MPPAPPTVDELIEQHKAKSRRYWLPVDVGVLVAEVERLRAIHGSIRVLRSKDIAEMPLDEAQTTLRYACGIISLLDQDVERLRDERELFVWYFSQQRFKVSPYCTEGWLLFDTYQGRYSQRIDLSQHSFRWDLVAALEAARALEPQEDKAGE